MTKNKVVVITLNYNQNSYSLECVKSVLESDYENFTLFLIDNGSATPNVVQLEKKLPLDTRLIFHKIHPNRGYVGGINYGMEKAIDFGADLILIMNNDTVLDKAAIKSLVQVTERHKYKTITSGKVFNYDEPNKFQDIGYNYRNKAKLLYNRIGLNETDLGQYDKEAERDLLDDVFWMIPIKLIHEIGFYSDYFWFNAEQADFALRAKKAGYKLIYTPEAKLWHKGSVSVGGRIRNPRLAYWHIQSTLIFRFRHLKKTLFFQQYIMIFLGIISSYIKASRLKNNSGKNKYNYPKAKLLGFLYFNKWLFLRNKNTGYNPFNNA